MDSMNRIVELGRGMALRVACAWMVVFGSGLAAAQMHHVDEPEHVTRAVGVYEWTGDLKKPGAARLIPVSLFINGHFEDAGVYLARPVPLALETGNVYILQHAGEPMGTVDVDYARDLVTRADVANDNPVGSWFGYGRYLPLVAVVEPKLPVSAHPAALVGSNDDDRPHFVNRSPAAGGSDNKGAPKGTGSTTTSGSAGQPADDPDRPTMTRRDAAGTAAGTTPGTAGDNAPSSPGIPDENDPERPTLGRRDTKTKEKKQRKESGSGVEAMPASLNEDPDRPEIHRGKVASATAAAPLTGVPKDMQQAVAVSDAATRDPHEFAREWDSPEERTETMAAMEKIAEPVAVSYLQANQLQAVSAPKLVTSKSAVASAGSSSAKARQAARRKAAAAKAAHTPAVTFALEQLTGYTLSYGGLPTFVYTAAVPVAGAAGQTVRVTVVAQRLPTGEMQTSLKSVTDDAHLDRTPWMRLVDAVDPDASHRASLLFELRGRNGRQFALYSLTSARAEQSFVTGVIE
jgi:hypothetical protein